MGDPDFHDVETSLLLLEELEPNERECNIVLIIKDVGTWLLKWRRSGFIFNNKDLILSDGITIHGTISFSSMQSFHHIVMGAQALSAIIAKGGARYTGDSSLLEFVAHKLSHKAPDSNLENATLPERSTRITSNDGSQQPIKTGWLLKKRDIMSGWKCRYFEVFPGRIEYFSDQYSMQPRGSISLSNAIIHPVKPIKVKRVKDYSGIVIETRNPEKVIKLASERTGLDGFVDANTWHQVFQIAARTEGSADALASPQSNPILPARPPSIRTHATIPLSRDSEDVVGAKQIVLYAICFLLAFTSLHYIYLFKAWINIKFYIAFNVVFTVILVIFIQEFLMSVEENEANSQKINQPIKRAISQMVVSIKAASGTSSNKTTPVKNINNIREEDLKGLPNREDINNASMYVHFDNHSDSDEADDDSSDEEIVQAN